MVPSKESPVSISIGSATLELMLWLDYGGRWIWLIRSGWPAAEKRRSLCHAELYAAWWIGGLRLFEGPELARYKLKMLVDLGLQVVSPVVLAALPATAPQAAQSVWRELASYLAIRRLCEDENEPFPLTAPWFADWTRLDENEVRAGRAWLDNNRYLLRVGDAPSRFPKRTILWQTSDGSTAVAGTPSESSR